VTKKVKLSILGISFSQVQAGAYALIFAEENGIRRLPIVIGTPEAQSIAIVMENIKPPRPLSHDLIYTIFQKLDIELKEVFIYKFEEGAFFSELLLLQMAANTVSIHARRMLWPLPCVHIRQYILPKKSCKIWLSFSTKTRRSMLPKTLSQEKKKINRSDDLSMFSTDELKSKLEEAVKDENYELATRLRDEIKKREHHS